MGLAGFVKRMVRTVTPRTQRAAGGTFLSTLPRAAIPALQPGVAATWVALTGGAVGAYAAVAALGTPAAEFWVEEILFMEGAATPCTGPCVVGLFTATATAPAVVANQEIAIDIPAAAIAAPHRAKLSPPAYFPGGTVLCAAVSCAGVTSGKLNVMAVISFNK